MCATFVHTQTIHLSICCPCCLHGLYCISVCLSGILRLLNSYIYIHELQFSANCCEKRPIRILVQSAAQNAYVYIHFYSFNWPRRTKKICFSVLSCFRCCSAECAVSKWISWLARNANVLFLVHCGQLLKVAHNYALFFHWEIAFFYCFVLVCEFVINVHWLPCRTEFIKNRFKAELCKRWSEDRRLTTKIVDKTYTRMLYSVVIVMESIGLG